MTLEDQYTYTLAENAMYQKVLDETVILDAHSGQYFTLDVITSQIVDLLKQNKTITEVANAIHADYDAPLQIIEEDITALVDEMVTKRLLKVMQ